MCFVRYYSNVVVYAINPRLGVAAGGTIVSVSGAFKPQSFLNITCKFGPDYSSAVVQALHADDAVIRCRVPPKKDVGAVRAAASYFLTRTVYCRLLWVPTGCSAVGGLNLVVAPNVNPLHSAVTAIGLHWIATAAATHAAMRAELSDHISECEYAVVVAYASTQY